jgi:hypothetical protein
MLSLFISVNCRHELPLQIEWRIEYRMVWGRDESEWYHKSCVLDGVKERNMLQIHKCNEEEEEEDHFARAGTTAMESCSGSMLFRGTGEAVWHRG